MVDIPSLRVKDRGRPWTKGVRSEKAGGRLSCNGELTESRRPSLRSGLRGYDRGGLPGTDTGGDSREPPGKGARTLAVHKRTEMGDFPGDTGPRKTQGPRPRRGRDHPEGAPTGVGVRGPSPTTPGQTTWRVDDPRTETRSPAPSGARTDTLEGWG